LSSRGVTFDTFADAFVGRFTHREAMDYRDQLIKDLREPKQLELFDDAERDSFRRLLVLLIEHEDEIQRMAEVFDKVLAGELGYAARLTRQREKHRRRAA
jgi:hypothetical protein